MPPTDPCPKFARLLPPADMRPRYPRWTQPLAVCAACGLWGLLGMPTISALVWAYLAVWLALALAKAFGAKGTELRWPTGLAVGVGALLLLPGLVLVIQHGTDIVRNDQLAGLASVLEDRAQSRHTPRIHPPVVRGDRPQVYWVGAPGASQVSLHISEGHTPLQAVSLGHGLFRLRYDPRAHGRPKTEADRANLTLLIDDASVPQTLAWVPSRARPQKLRPVPGGDAAIAVSDETDELLWLGAPGLVRRSAVGDGPVAAVATSSRTAYVAHRYAPYVLGVDLVTGAITSTTPLPMGQTDIVEHAGWLAIPTEDPPAIWLGKPGQPPSKIDLPAVPERVCFAGDAQTLVVSSRRARSLMRLRLVDGAWSIDPLMLGRPVTALACDPQGRSVHVAVSDHRPDDDTGSNHAVMEQWLSIDMEAWLVTRGVATQGLVPEGAFGTASMLMQDGLLMAAFEGSAHLHVRGGKGPSQSPLHSPNGLLRLHDGTWLVSSAAQGAVAWMAPRTLSTLMQSQLQSPDAHRRALSRGERNFAEATRSGTSCASCHPGRDSDHAFHDIGHGHPRPTLSIRGLAGTSPFLRGASYPDLGGLNDFARTILGGYVGHAPDRAEDLKAYIFSLPPPDAPARQAATSQDRLRRGLHAFVAAGCAECHQGPAFTNLAQYPSAMLFPDQSARVFLDTPSLLGVSTSPPYLFDGRASTLRSIFETHNPQERHGAFHELDEAQQDDLLDLLEVL